MTAEKQRIRLGASRSAVGHLGHQIGELFYKLSIEDFPKPLSYPSKVSSQASLLDNPATAQPLRRGVFTTKSNPDRGVARLRGYQGDKGGGHTQRNSNPHARKCKAPKLKSFSDLRNLVSSPVTLR